MKQIITCILATVLTLGTVCTTHAQDNYDFATQTDVDIFPLFCDPCDSVGLIRIDNRDGFISNLDSLRQIRHIGGGLLMSFNLSNVERSGLHNVESISGSWRYTNWPNIDTVSSWVKLRDLSNGELRISEFSDVRAVLGFEGIDSTRRLVLDSPDLTTFDAFHDLVYLGRLRTRARALDSIKISDKITTLDQFWVRGCDELRYVSCLPSLDSIGDLEITNTPSLNDAFYNMGLTKVHKVDLWEQPGMSDLSWLSTLDYLKEVKIREMPDLTTIEDIDVAMGLIEAVQMTDNPNLSDCNTDWLCHYLRDTSNVADIADNGVGCSSREEILAQCIFTDIEDVLPSDDMVVYPNPVSDRLRIEGQCIDCTYKIIDALGRLVLRGVWDTEGIRVQTLRAGKYQILIEHVDRVQQVAFVKL